MKQRAPEQPIICASQRRKGLRGDVMLSQKGLSHNGAKMRKRAPTQSRSCGTEGLGANYNKIRFLPYISNPALAGFNFSLWSSLPVAYVTNIILGETPGPGLSLT